MILFSSCDFSPKPQVAYKIAFFFNLLILRVCLAKMDLRGQEEYLDATVQRYL